MRDRKAKRLMDQLLCKVPELRRGNNYSALKAQAWFSNFSWDESNNNEISVTFKPLLIK